MFKRRKRTKKKKFHLHVHAVRRLRERYDESVTRHDVEQINSKIRHNRRGAELIGYESNTRSRWLVEHRGKKLPVIYNHKVKSIATVLPEGALEEWRRLYDI